MIRQSILAATALFCFAPLVCITAVEKNSLKTYQDDQIVGDFPIIGSYGSKSFILGSGASIAFEITKEYKFQTKHWKIGDIVRQIILEDSSLYELQNLTSGRSVKAEAVSLDEYRYTSHFVGILCVISSKSNDIFLADHNHYKILDHGINPQDWQKDDPVHVEKSTEKNNWYLLKNRRSGAKIEAEMTPPFQSKKKI